MNKHNVGDDFSQISPFANNLQIEMTDSGFDTQIRKYYIRPINIFR